MTNFTPFDVADYLDNEVTIAAYLNAALEDPDPDAFLVAVKAVARARGMTQLQRIPVWGAKAFTRRSLLARSRVTRR